MKDNEVLERVNKAFQWYCDRKNREAKMKETGLSLKEAIESGRRFRRSDDLNWVSIDEHNPFDDALFSVSSILATDYELEPLAEEKITVTKKQMEAEFEKAFGPQFTHHTVYGLSLACFNNMLLALGFK